MNKYQKELAKDIKGVRAIFPFISFSKYRRVAKKMMKDPKYDWVFNDTTKKGE